MVSSHPHGLQPVLLGVLLVTGHVAPQARPRAVWADEVESAGNSEGDRFRPVAAPGPAAVWADEMEMEAEVRVSSSANEKPGHDHLWGSDQFNQWCEDNTLTSAKIELSETSQKIEHDHNSTPVIEKNPIDRKFDITGKKSNLFCASNVWAVSYGIYCADGSGENLRNETRQLEIAFPIGIAIGAIGAAILPTLFPGSTTTTTTQEWEIEH